MAVDIMVVVLHQSSAVEDKSFAESSLTAMSYFLAYPLFVVAAEVADLKESCLDSFGNFAVPFYSFAGDDVVVKEIRNSFELQREKVILHVK